MYIVPAVPPRPVPVMATVREIIRQFTPNWFTVIIGTGTLALALNEVSGAVPGLYRLADPRTALRLLILGYALWAFSALLVTLVLRLVLHRGSPRRSIVTGGLSLSAERVERRLAAILAADVAGYSRLMGQDEMVTLSRLKAMRRGLIDPELGAHNGRVVKAMGDGLLIEFPSVVEGVACALALQRGIAEGNTVVPKDQRIEFRIGINVGDIIVDGDDIHGDGVNIAARLEALAEPGGICVSRAVITQIRGKLDFQIADLGEQMLKNIVQPVHVFRVLVHGSCSNRATQLL